MIREYILSYLKRLLSSCGSCWKCCFFLHGSKCRCCYSNSFSASVFKRDFYASKVWKLSSFRFVVCVRNVVSCKWAFACDCTSSWHNISLCMSPLLKIANILWDYREFLHSICLMNFSFFRWISFYFTCGVVILLTFLEKCPTEMPLGQSKSRLYSQIALLTRVFVETEARFAWLMGDTACGFMIGYVIIIQNNKYV